MTITYTTGDATQPTGDGLKMIAHICNDEGKWGSGFVIALSRRWPLAEIAYRAWFRTGNEFELGAVQYVSVASGIGVANMIAQRGVRHDMSAPPAVRYDALRKALRDVAQEAHSAGASVHMPRIGCGLGGGDWDKVEAVINDTLILRGIAVTVYDLPGKGN